MNYSNQNQYGQSQFGGASNIGFAESRYGGPTGQANYDNKNSQFRGSDSEIKALFDAFQRNGKVDLREFLDVLASTGIDSFPYQFFFQTQNSNQKKKLTCWIRYE